MCGHRAIVLVGYDICGNEKLGLYPVEKFTKVNVGILVKLSVKRSFFRVAKTVAIVGKAKSRVFT